MNRLNCIKNMVDKCKTVADIGTDHGYVAEMLLSENICKNIIASDLNEGPLKSAIKNLSKASLSSRCSFRLGNGLEVLKEKEAETIIIAGMGGDLISEIIENNKSIAMSADYLILQPMTAVNNLRKYLFNNGFKIVDENIVKEQHFYFIIKAKKGSTEEQDNIYEEISKILLQKKEPLMVEYINKVLHTNEKIISSLEKTNKEEYNVKIEELKEKNKKIRNLLYEYQLNN